MATMIDGIPVPGRTDAADAPANFTVQTEAIVARLKAIDGISSSGISADDSHSERITALEASVAALSTDLNGKITTLQTSMAALQAELDASQLKYDNLIAWTKLDTIRIETGTRVYTADVNGSAVLTYRQPFKTPPRVLLTFGSTAGLAAANGSGWNTTYPPGPWTTDNSASITNHNLRIGGVKGGGLFRVSYLAIGAAAYTDRAAASGGPGFDIG